VTFFIPNVSVGREIEIYMLFITLFAAEVVPKVATKVAKMNKKVTIKVFVKRQRNKKSD
jgi:hypothetical protein